MTIWQMAREREWNRLWDRVAVWVVVSVGVFVLFLMLAASIFAYLFWGQTESNHALVQRSITLSSAHHKQNVQEQQTIESQGTTIIALQKQIKGDADAIVVLGQQIITLQTDSHQLGQDNHTTLLELQQALNQIEASQKLFAADISAICKQRGLACPAP